MALAAGSKKLTEKELQSLNARLEGVHPSETLKWVDATFGNCAAQMSSFGLEDVALFDMFWRINPKARVMTLDTLRLPTETYTLFDQSQLRYQMKIEAFYPDMKAVQEMVRERGFNLFYRGVENRKFCCHIRKVEPLERALSGLDAWVTGLRRDQGMDRGKIAIVEWDEPHQNYKVNPLANWTFEQCREYVQANNVPYNELHDKGYPSLGCAPCTRAIQPGEDIRAGRWWWEADPNAKECGLHIVGAATR
jgi:phosphoadenosine phosphosulfate reductase